MGAQSIIVIPVKFPDKSNFKTVDEIYEMVFSKMNGYFVEVSYGSMWFAGFVLPKWYLLPHFTSYYGAKEALLRDIKWKELIDDGIKAADSDVDYRQYRYVMIVHSGEFWPSFALDIDSASVSTNDGIVQPSVCVLSEFDQLGAFAHETGHMLGLPDLYDYDHHDSRFVGNWDLMGGGSTNGPFWTDPNRFPGTAGSFPAHISAWGKIKLGWIDQSQVLIVKPGTSTFVTVEQLEEQTSSIKAMILPITQNQYFLVETRKKVRFDYWAPFESDRIKLLIYYVNETILSGHGPIRLENALSPPKTGTTQSGVPAVQEGQYRFAITLLSATSDSFSLKADYHGYGTTIRTTVPNIPITCDNETFSANAAGSVDLRVSYCSHLITVPQTVPRGFNSRYYFSGWSDGETSLTRRIIVRSDMSINVKYKTQHRLNINSQYGTTTGAGWYDENTQATFSLTNPVQNTTRDGVRYSAVSYSGDATGSGSSGSVAMDRPKTITFNWLRQHLLSISSNTAVSPPAGSSWHKDGESATIIAVDRGGYRFLGWTLDGAAKLGSSITVQMYGPRNLTANYGWPSTFAQNVEVASSSDLSEYSYDAKNRVVSFVVSGDSGTIGFSTVRIPKQLLWSESPTVKIDGQIPLLYGINDGGSAWIISFSYIHSDHLVTIPEFHQPGLMLVVIFSVVMVLSRRAIRDSRSLTRDTFRPEKLQVLDIGSQVLN